MELSGASTSGDNTWDNDLGRGAFIILVVILVVESSMFLEADFLLSAHLR